MKIDNVISSMRRCVEYYDALQNRIGGFRSNNIAEPAEKLKKGGNTMKAGTVIAIITAVIALLAAGAAAAVYFGKKHCLLCNDVDDDLYGDFPDEDCSDSTAEAPADAAPAAEESVTPAEQQADAPVEEPAE